MAILLLLTLRSLLFPSAVSSDTDTGWTTKLRRRGTLLLSMVVSCAAVGLVLPSMLTSHHWLIPFSAVVLILVVAVLQRLANGRAKPFAVACRLLVVTGVVAYWEMGESFWVGVLPF